MTSSKIINRRALITSFLYSIFPVKPYTVPFVLCGAFLLCGCSTLYSYTIGMFDEEVKVEESPPVQSPSTDSQPQRKSSVAMEQGQSPTSQSKEDIELLWRIPPEDVEGFIVSYRIGQGGKPIQEKLYADKLQKFDDKTLGFVYRYVIKDIPSSLPVFATIAAFRGEVISSPSEVITSAPKIKRELDSSELKNNRD